MPQGKENCCEEIRPVTYTPPVEQKIFSDDMLDNPTDDNSENVETKTEEKPIVKKTENNTTKKTQKDKKAKEKDWWGGLFGKLKQGTEDFVGRVTEDDKDDYDFNN